MSEVDPKALSARVPAALGVIDAILKGTMLPEPTEAESESLGLADFDPELRYRVARDVIEQAYGKPKQQVEIEGDFRPEVLLLPSFVSQEAPQLPSVTVGPVEDLPADPEPGGTDATDPAQADPVQRVE